MTQRHPLTGPDVWTGAALAASGDWVRTLDADHRAEIAAALDLVRHHPPCGFDAAAFPLPRTASLLHQVAQDLEHGRGMVRLRGLVTDGLSEDDLRRMFWGIGQHLGTPIYQNATGEIMGAVRDETRLANPTFAPVETGRVASARARSRSTGLLRWHTDRCDVIGLFCVRNARAGGVSKLVSIPALYNAILQQRPDLLALLCQDYWRARPADEDGTHGAAPFAMPIFAFADGRITSQYSRTYVEQAQELPGVPRLTAAQTEALDLLADTAEALCLHSAFVPGDIQLLNNHVIYHGRTAYEDGGDGQDRLLLRLWLAMPNSRRLPDGFETLWGATEAGALRGGVVQPHDLRRGPI